MGFSTGDLCCLLLDIFLVAIFSMSVKKKKKKKFAEPENYLKDQHKTFVSKIVLHLIGKKRFSLQPFFFPFLLLRTQR